PSRPSRACDRSSRPRGKTRMSRSLQRRTLPIRSDGMSEKRKRALCAMRIARLIGAFRMSAILAGGLGLTACATFSADTGMNAVASVAKQELRKDVVFVRSETEAIESRARVDRLLKRALTVDAAVQIALLNNR